MIVWPDEARLKSEAREALRRLRETSGAAELEGAKESWRLVSWPWTTEAPMRFVFENGALDAIELTIGADGMWRRSDVLQTPHLRSAESLDREARGLLTAL